MLCAGVFVFHWFWLSSRTIWWSCVRRPYGPPATGRALRSFRIYSLPPFAFKASDGRLRSGSWFVSPTASRAVSGSSGLVDSHAAWTLWGPPRRVLVGRTGRADVPLCQPQAAPCPGEAGRQVLTLESHESAEKSAGSQEQPWTGLRISNSGRIRTSIWDCPHVTRPSSQECRGSAQSSGENGGRACPRASRRNALDRPPGSRTCIAGSSSCSARPSGSFDLTEPRWKRKAVNTT